MFNKFWILKILIIVYLFFLLFCYTLQFFKHWDDISYGVYYIWDKSFGGGFVSWLCIYLFSKEECKYLLAPVVFFSFIRLSFEVIGFFFDISPDNDYRVALLFISLIFFVLCLFVNKDNLLTKSLGRLFK